MKSARSSIAKSQKSKSVAFKELPRYSEEILKYEKVFQSTPIDFLDVLGEINKDGLSQAAVKKLLEVEVNRVRTANVKVKTKRLVTLDLNFPEHNDEDYVDAFDEYSTNHFLRDPFWQQQFALKKIQRDHILDSYHLVSAEHLKKDCFPGWSANDPFSAMNKRAERNQVLSIMVGGQRLYPLEQFDVRADTPKLTPAFSEILKAFIDNGEITQEEMLYWLCSAQQLPMPHDSLVHEAITNQDIEQGWDTLRAAGPSDISTVYPLDRLLRGDKDTVLRLFYDWTDIEQDGPAHTREELIDAVKHLLAVERISINELTQG